MSVPQNLKPYRDLGIVFSNQNGKDATGICPFCDYKEHFNVEIETGKFHCVYCDEAGNPASFIQKVWEASANNLDVQCDGDPYVYYDPELVADRGVSPETLKAAGVVVSCIDGRWLLPIYNFDGVLVNLGLWSEVETDVRTVYYVSGMKQWLYGLDSLTSFQEKPPREIWIMEGPWDRIATLDFLYRCKAKGSKIVETAAPKDSIGNDVLVLAKPAAGTFDVEWAVKLRQLFPGGGVEVVRVFPHNDHPKINTKTKKVTHAGWDGGMKTCAAMKEAGWKDVVVFRWGTDSRPECDLDLKSGFDVRDYWKDDFQDSPAQLYTHLTKSKCVVPYDPKDPHQKAPKVRASKGKADVANVECEAIPVDSFEELLAAYEKYLYVPIDLKHTITLGMAAVLSTPYPGDPIFTRIIGPPGCGKTVFAESLSGAREFVTPLSKLTGFHSGYVEHYDYESDNSLMPRIKNKACVVKDADTIMSSNARDTILSELRDIFDGTSRSAYRNKAGKDYEDFKTTFILCGTDSLRGLQKTYLGERFLDIEVIAEDQDANPYLKQGMRNTVERMRNFRRPSAAEVQDDVITPSMMQYIRPRVYGFLQHFSNPEIELPTLSESREQEIAGLAKLVASMRAQVDPNLRDLGVASRGEFPTRVASQTIKWAMMTGLILGKKTIDDEVMQPIRKMILNTCIGHRIKVARYLYNALENDIITRKHLEVHLGIPDTTLVRIIKQMSELKLIVNGTIKNASGTGGRDAGILRLSKDLRAAFKDAKIPRILK